MKSAFTALLAGALVVGMVIGSVIFYAIVPPRTVVTTSYSTQVMTSLSTQMTTLYSTQTITRTHVSILPVMVNLTYPFCITPDGCSWLGSNTTIRIIPLS
jgi:hypothetical protein